MEQDSGARGFIPGGRKAPVKIPVLRLSSGRYWGPDMRGFIVACFFLLGFIGAAGAEPEKRVALVIGQNACANFTSLDNPAPDARTMAALLSKNGFEVISCGGKEACFDLSREGLLEALAQLEARAKGATLALVYYAGHGVATEQHAYDAPISRASRKLSSLLEAQVETCSLIAGSIRFK
jgi:hypothetical protein